MAKSIWQKTYAMRHRLGTMKELRAIGIGFKCNENYLKGLVEQGKVAR